MSLEGAPASAPAGCNTLKIQYSTFGELTVKYNNAKTRDFLNTDLPAGPEAGAGPSGGAGPNSYGMQQQGQQMCARRGVVRDALRCLLL